MKAAVFSEELPQELITEIISRLPSKSLARFNCVCNHWNYSLTTNAFLLHHSRCRRRAPWPPTQFPNFYAFCFQYNNMPRLLYRDMKLFWFHFHDNEEDNTSRPLVKPLRMFLPVLPPTPAHRRYVVVSNLCNGLFCLFSDIDAPLLLFSVRSNSFLVLPNQMLHQEVDLVTGSPLEYWYSVGFDPEKREYKILSIIGKHYNITNTSNYYGVLTLGSKSWKLIDPNCVPSSFDAPGFPHRESFCLHGVIYWIHLCSDKNVHFSTIASFNLGREEFRALHFDQVVGSSYINVVEQKHCFLTPLNGCPTLFVWVKGYDELLQFTLSDHPNVGTTTRRICLTSEIDPSPHPCSCYCYVGANIILMKVLRSRPLRYLCYDLEKCDYKDIEIEGVDRVLQIHADLETDIA